ncbi:MAG TPA: DUF167 domain-containing protein [Kiritimatiellia bacterium]|nr:DUF167 domain-containing protein [Kiritimatiellia bacterium]
MNCFTASKDGVVISVKIIPNAPRCKVDGLLGDYLKIRIQAPPVDGKANAALLKFLAKELGVPVSHLTVLSGHTGRIKRIAVSGVNKQQAECSLVPGT